LKLIGLTGGAGTGKSTVAEMFRELGAAVVDADEAAHAVYAPGTPGFEAVVSAFGAGYVRDGAIDRAGLGQLVFHDGEARRRLNHIVHPLIREWMARRTAEAVDMGAEFVLHDVPLLFENGLESLYAEVVLVYAPLETQVRRLVDGRHIDEDLARAMVASQMPIEVKRPRARYVVDNGGTREATRAQVTRIWAEITGSG
jgi:dephospho-CoA kinase